MASPVRSPTTLLVTIPSIRSDALIWFGARFRMVLMPGPVGVIVWRRASTRIVSPLLIVSV